MMLYPIKILMITTSYPNRLNKNAGIFVHQQFSHLSNLGCDIEVVQLVPKSFLGYYRKLGVHKNNFFVDGIKVTYGRYRRIPSKYGHSLSTRFLHRSIGKNIEEIIKEFRPDILHAQWLTPAGYYGLKLSEKYNIPLVTTARGSDVNTYPHYDNLSFKLTKEVIRKSEQIIAVSQNLKNKIEGIAKPKKDVEVIYTGCNTGLFEFNAKSRAKIRKKLGINETDKVFIFVGSVQKSKGIWELIRSFNLLMQKRNDLKLIVVGEGKESNAIAEYCVQHELENKVFLVGRQPHHLIYRWLSAADVLVLPSYNEGLPNAVVEALACDRFVIATEVGGLPEIIQDGVNGLLVRPRDTEHLTYAIEKVLAKEKYLCKTNFGRNYVLEQFDWARNANELLRIYQTLI